MARYLGLLALLCTLASCGSSSAASTAGAASASCGPAGARTLARGAQARVYTRNHVVYGCAGARGRSVRLGGSALCPGAPRVGPVAVAGRLAAYASRSCGVDTSSTTVIVRRLSDGHLLSSHGATQSPPAPESFQNVGSVVVRSGGAVAWIGSSMSIAVHRPAIDQVFEFSGGTLRRLDQGAGIGLGSLKLSGSKLTWEHNGARSATLG